MFLFFDRFIVYFTESRSRIHVDLKSRSYIEFRVYCFSADFQAQEWWQEQAQPWSREPHQVLQLREMLPQGTISLSLSLNRFPMLDLDDSE